MKITQPAFPSVGYGETGQYPEHFLGMSLIQYYVGQIAVNEKCTLGGFGAVQEKELDDYAKRCFLKAEALIRYEQKIKPR